MSTTNAVQIVGVKDYTFEMLMRIFKLADGYRDALAQRKFEELKVLRNCLAFNYFYSPSTRTRTSFDVAMERLGMIVEWSEAAGQFSKTVQGEILEHSVRIYCGYGADVFVLRHGDDDAAERASVVCKEMGVPFLNAGSGSREHPTQFALDFYIMLQDLMERGLVEQITNRHVLAKRPINLLVSMDPEFGRTIRSVVRGLARFLRPLRVWAWAPSILTLGEDILRELEDLGVPFEGYVTDVRRILPMIDIHYHQRPQYERMSPEKRKIVEMNEPSFKVGLHEMALLGGLLYHPMPIVNEVDRAVDTHPKARYFPQAAWGLPVRMGNLVEVVRR
ncbi:MAG: hypothetical protein PHV93_00335 [Candidatus Pacebacteria bacterium]|nr:hypothetical protein [Candidatus Paceibacterota bacterium]